MTPRRRFTQTYWPPAILAAACAVNATVALTTGPVALLTVAYVCGFAFLPVYAWVAERRAQR